MMAPAVFEPGFVQLPYFHIFFCSFPDILRRILGIDAEFHARIGQLFIDFPEECRDLVKQAVPWFFRCFLPYPRILVCIGFELGPVDIQMLKIHMFCFEDFPINVIEYFFDGIPKHFIDEVAEGTVRWNLIPHKIHKPKIDPALVLQFP